ARPGQDGVAHGKTRAGGGAERGRAAVPGEGRDGGERDRLVGLVHGRRLGDLRRRVVVGGASLVCGDVAAAGRGRGQRAAADQARPGQDGEASAEARGVGGGGRGRAAAARGGPGGQGRDRRVGPVARRR